MTGQDLDQQLRVRLERLASAVPIADAATAPDSRLVRRQVLGKARALPSSLALGAVLMAVTAIAVGASLIGRPSGPGASPPPLVAVVLDGPFELEVRTPRATVNVGDSIDVAATLSYRGPDARVSVAGPGVLVVFGIEQLEGPLVAPFITYAAQDAICVQHELAANEPLEAPFRKWGGMSDDDPNAAFLRAYYKDPVLRLPAGSWRIYAQSVFAESGPADVGCGGLPGRSLVASLTVRVIDPAAGPTQDAPRDVAGDGRFQLAISAPKGRYAPNEPIDISAALTYFGPSESIDVFHGLGAHGSPMGFGIEEPVLGDLTLGPGWDLVCERTSLDFGEPLSVDFQKSAGWSSSDPQAAAYRAYVEDPELRLPAGTWHIYAVAQFARMDCGGLPHDLRAEITIVVGEGSEPSDAPGANLTDPSARPYPEGCVGFGLEPDRCARIASWAVAQASVSPAELTRIEFFGEPEAPCANPEACAPTAKDGFVVRARIVRNDGTWTDRTVICPTGSSTRLGPINSLCVEIARLDGQPARFSFPSITTPTSSGYMDTPCNPGPAPIGCATPLPSLEPEAADGARPLTIDDLDIPIDHVGTYSIPLGTAVLPNGILDTATMDVTSSPLNPLISSDGYRLEIDSLDGGPAFDNYYLRGWHPGTEQVEVTLTFTVNWFEPGAVVHIADVDIH